MEHGREARRDDRTRYQGTPHDETPHHGTPPHETPHHETLHHETLGDEGRLRDALHEEAARHRPDREAMLVRIAARRDAERAVEHGRVRAVRPARAARAARAARPARRLVRVAGLGVVSVLLLAASVAGTWAAVGRYVGPGPASRTEPGGSTDIGSATSVPRPTASSTVPSGPGGTAGGGAAPVRRPRPRGAPWRAERVPRPLRVPRRPPRRPAPRQQEPGSSRASSGRTAPSTRTATRIGPRAT